MSSARFEIILNEYTIKILKGSRGVLLRRVIVLAALKITVNLMMQKSLKTKKIH